MGLARNRAGVRPDLVLLDKTRLRPDGLKAIWGARSLF